MATFVRDVQLGKFINSCAVMSNHRLLVADASNTVTLVDIFSGRHLSRVTLPAQPLQVAKLSDREAAVTMPAARKIAIMRTEPEVSVEREISVNGGCRGVACADKTFIVTYWEGHLDIIDTTGSVVRTVKTDKNGGRLFKDPHHVCVSSDKESVYISDRGTSAVVKLSMDGSVLASNVCSSRPGQMATGLTTVYVAMACGHGGHGNVEQLTRDCDKVSTIVSDLDIPLALAYDRTAKELYVGDNDALKVYMYKLRQYKLLFPNMSFSRN